MKQAIKPQKQKVIDFNPFSKANTEFRKRHDISVKDFKRYTENYKTQYSAA